MGNHAASHRLIHIGSRIRERRMEVGMSQETLAEKAGISSNTVSRIEGGLTAMSIEIFQELVQILGLDADALLCHAGVSDTGERNAKDILGCISRLGREDQEIVVQTVKALADALEKGRHGDTGSSLDQPFADPADML